MFRLEIIFKKKAFVLFTVCLSSVIKLAAPLQTGQAEEIHMGDALIKKNKVSKLI